MKLLLIDDEEDIRTFLEYNLSKLNLEIQTAKNSQEALSKYKSFSPDIVILDIMMTGLDGIETCKEIRLLNLHSYIVMLSASSDDYTKIKAYEAGCDDFVGKPINIQLFTKKIQAIKSRLEKNNFSVPSISKKTNNYNLEINNIRINLETYTVFVGDKPHNLPKKQFELLTMLADNPDKVHTREKIYDQIWGDTIVNERTIDVHITRIRNKLEIDCIKSVKGVGYKLVTDA
tara:strand:+ start:137 stop:829 length:693 start_codon:yes stop_codon:yes gene_type:complete